MKATIFHTNSSIRNIILTNYIKTAAEKSTAVSKTGIYMCKSSAFMLYQTKKKKPRLAPNVIKLRKKSTYPKWQYH